MLSVALVLVISLLAFDSHEINVVSEETLRELQWCNNSATTLQLPINPVLKACVCVMYQW